MQRLRTTLLACAALLGTAGIPQAATMSSGWQEISLSQDQCLSVGVNAVQAMGFQADRQQFFVGGWRGVDGIVVRCAADRGMAIIFVYLSEGTAAEASQMVEQIVAIYRGGVSRGGK